MMMMIKSFEVLVSFTRIGLFGFGGGPSMLPLVQREIVTYRGWLDREQFLDAFAFGNALPGPIVTKLAGYIGYRVAGVPGAIMGLIGISVPTAIAMIALATFYTLYSEHPVVSSFLGGVRPVVIALLVLVVWEFAPAALGKPPQWFKNWPLWLIALVAFILAAGFGVHPAALIVAGGLIGIFLLR